MNDDQMWQALLSKDKACDGKFYYGVVTTGVFCQPSCPSKLPLRQNVRFFDTPDQALAADLRACKRCRPTDMASEDFAEICRYLEQHSDEALPLETLSRMAGLSPSHFQRRFKALIGVSPRQYLENCRLNRVKQELKAGSDVTSAVYAAGFGSGSRLYEKLDTRLGMTPGQYRSGGKGLTISYAAAQTPLGELVIGATDRGLCFLQFGPEAELIEQLRKEYPQASLQPMPDAAQPAFASWIEALNLYLTGETAPPDLPLDIQGTAFQLKVWSYLQQIPTGEVQSYAEVATGIGQPTAARAVARACASNRVALVIPCHRVIRGSGELGGYRWGIERKRVLLDGERKFSRVHAG